MPRITHIEDCNFSFNGKNFKNLDELSKYLLSDEVDANNILSQLNKKENATTSSKIENQEGNQQTSVSEHQGTGTSQQEQTIEQATTNEANNSNRGGNGAGTQQEEKVDSGDNNPQRRFTQQMIRDEDLTPESKTEISKTLDYVRQTNSMSIAEARNVLNKIGADEAQHLVINDGDIKPAVRVVLGQSLIKHFNELSAKATDQATKDFYTDKTIETAKFVTEKLATEPGQMIQAFSLYSRLSPEAQLRDAVQDVAKQAKEKMNRRKPDVNKIGDKFKKANEETVDEITKSPKIKKAVSDADNIRIKKAKDKIQQARQKRADIIKKYKSEKGKNLYSTVGLTKEGIEFVGDIVKTYIDEGVADLQILFEKVKGHLEDAAKKPINDEIKKQITDIANEGLDKVANKKIAGGVQELEKNIEQIVRKHYTVSEEQKKSLTQKFIEQTGLDKDEADKLSKEIQSEFDRIATRKKQNILYNEKARFEKIQKGLQGVNKVEPKTLQSEMIKYSNLGAFENPDFADMIADKLGLGKITPDEAKTISQLAEKVEKAPEGSPKNDATQDLLKYRANLKGSTWGEVAQGVWYANVLSGYLTHLKNIVSTFFNGMAFYGSEAVKNPKSIPFLTVGGLKGLKRGGIEAWHTLTTGRSPIHVSKVETPSILERKNFVGGYLNPANYLKFVGRLLTAEDVLQFQGLKEMRATQLAYREAAHQGYKNPFSKAAWNIVNEKLLNTKQRLEEANAQVKEEGLSGIEAKRRTYELMEQSRPIQMTEDAYGFAAKGTFNHESEGTLGALTNAVSQALNGFKIGGTQPLKYIVPFTRIITNVVNTGLDFSPIGYVRALRGERGFKSFEQWNPTKGAYHELTKEEKNQLIARASLGVGLTAALYVMSQQKDKDGKPILEITGGGTGNYKRDIQLRQEGWQPYSIKIGDKYYSYRLTPLFFNLGFVGNMNDSEKYSNKESDKTFLHRMSVASYRFGNQLADMTWINSAGTFLGAFADNANTSALGSNIQNSLTQMAKGFVIPQGYTQAAQEYENIFNVPQKQVNNAWQSMVQDIPIARNSLNDKINALGEPIVRDVDLMQSKETKDPVWKYLFEKNGWIAPVNKNTLLLYNAKTQQDELATNDQYYEYSKERGAKIKNSIKNLLENGAMTTIDKNGNETVTTNYNIATGFKSAESLTSMEVQKLLREISSEATKDTKKEFYYKELIKNNK